MDSFLQEHFTPYIICDIVSSPDGEEILLKDNAMIENNQSLKSGNRFERHKKLTLFLFVVVIILCIDLLAGEFFLTHPDPIRGRIANPYYHHGLEPMYHDIESWGAGPYDFYTNSLGFKDNANRVIPLTINQHRIVFMGDSFTEGIGIPYSETFVGRITETLKPRGYDVLDAGVASYAPTLYYIKTKYLLEHGLKFDELIVFIDLSDVQDELFYKDWTPTTPDSWRTRYENLTHTLDFFFEHHSLVYLHGLRPLILGEDKRRLRAFFFGGGRVTAEEAKYIADRGRWTFDERVYQEWGKDGVALEIARMNDLYELCKKYHIKLSVGVYPWPVTIMNKDVNSRQISIWQNFAKEHAIDFYNIFPPFMATTTPVAKEVEIYYLPNDTHWTSAGHKVVADTWLAQYAQKNKETKIK